MSSNLNPALRSVHLWKAWSATLVTKSNGKAHVPWWVGSVPRAALGHSTHREAGLTLRHWPGAELLISFRLKKLFAAKTSLPKDNFIILIIRRPVMIKCLFLASVWRVSCWQAAYYGKPFVLWKKQNLLLKSSKKKFYLSLEVEKVQLINLFLSL